MIDTRHVIHLGPLVLSDGFEPVEHDGPFWFEVLGDDATWGNPQPVEVAMRQLEGGSLVRNSYDDPREANLRIRVRAYDSISLAAGEVRLALELGKRNTLAWTPPDGYGPTTVFEVLASNEEFVFDDLDELRFSRTYALRFVCEPYSRSLDPVVTTAAVVGGTTPETPVDELVDDCSVTTGWTCTASPFDAINGYLRTPGSVAGRFTRTGTVTLTDSPYLIVDWARVGVAPSPTRFPDPVLSVVDGDDVLTAAPIAKFPAPGKPGWTRSVWSVDVPSIDALSLLFSDYVGSPRPATAQIQIDEVRRTNLAPYSGTTHQKTRTVDVTGSAPSPGSLHLSHETDGLGSVLVYTSPNAVTPALRPFRTSGSTPTSDALAVSGAYDVLDTATVFTVPISAVPPGEYVILCRVGATATGTRTIDWTAETQIDGAVVAPSASGSAPVAFGTTGYRYAPLGLATLPPVAVPVEAYGGDTAAVKITVVDSAPGDATDLHLDEVWLFNTTTGRLSWVEADTALHLWIDSPTTDDPIARYWVGNEADRSDARHVGLIGAYPAILARDVHLFTPPRVNVFTVTAGALDASASFEHHPRWRTHVAEGRRLAAHEIP